MGLRLSYDDAQNLLVLNFNTFFQLPTIYLPIIRKIRKSQVHLEMKLGLTIPYKQNVKFIKAL